MTNFYPAFSDRWFYTLLAMGVALNATGLLPPIMEVDGALYACIAKTMVQTGDYTNLYAVGTDWLDKPHFPFWVIALSYRLLGINTVAYKLPALLFFLASVAYTYHFARLTYSKLVAQIATLVLLTAFHGVLSNSDVRAEPYLMPLIIGPVYHFYRVFLDRPNQTAHLLLGSLLTGCALMTKGVFVLIPIGSGLVLHWVLTGQWRELLKLRWYAAIALAFVCTLPEVYALYQQFDLHPGKVIFGKTGVSGVRFFFWDSQFGRFFNTGPIKGEGDKFFFVHTLLWAFLPWSLPLYASIGKTIMGLVKQQSALPEFIAFGSGLATFVLFSLSGFQLPHYLNIVFPFYAVLTAQFLSMLRPLHLGRWVVAQTVIGLLLTALMAALLVLVQPTYLTSALGLILVITLATYLLFRSANLLSLMGRMVGVMLVVAGALNLALYPTFLRYQAGSAAAYYASTQPALANRATILYEPGTGVGGGSFWSYEFYAQTPTAYARSDSSLRVLTKKAPAPVFTTVELADSLSNSGFTVRTLAVFPYYHVSQLTYEFLNPATRSQALSAYVLAEVNGE